MKISLSIPKPVMVLFACVIGFQIVAFSQDAEKQKIINIITGELDHWYNKDREKWANSIVQSDEFLLTTASTHFYHSVKTFDSLNAQSEKYFSTPPDPNVLRITKTDFKVNIKGNIAIVDLTQRADNFPNPFSSDQTILMEKQGKTWKILRQQSVVKTDYELNDKNIEGALNTQGYNLIQLKKLDDAIRVFTLNTQLFPNAWNTWDSLADAYMKKGEKQIAIGFFKKSLELNPKNGYAKEMVEQMEKNQ
jgi:tetratricopeptide (TPR) repeat protein